MNEAKCSKVVRFVMVQNADTSIIFVADPAWEIRVPQSGGPNCLPAKGCTNVYDALAQAVLNARGGRSAMLCIRIDTLNPDEMPIFQCLAKLPNITALTYYAVHNPTKYAMAHSAGATHILPADQLIDHLNPILGERAFSANCELTNRTTTSLPPKPAIEPADNSKTDNSSHDIELTKIAEKNVADDLSKLIQQQIGKISGTSEKMDIPTAPAADNEKIDIAPTSAKAPKQALEKPLLTPEEIQALLG